MDKDRSHATDFDMQVAAGGNYDPNDPTIRTSLLRRLSGYDFFVVTLFEELEKQPVVRQTLEREYRQIDGEGYLLYDLNPPD